MPAEYIGLQLRQSKKLTVVGCNTFLCYGKTTQYTMVRLHHGIPHGITMVRTRGNTAWPVNHSGLIYTIVRQRGNITGNVSLSYRGTALSNSQ